MRPLVHVFASKNKNHSVIIVKNHQNENVSMEFPIDPLEFIKMYHAWTTGELIQNVFANVSADHREFLMTGMTPEEWDELTLPRDHYV